MHNINEDPPYEKRDNQRKSQKDDVIKLREKFIPKFQCVNIKIDLILPLLPKYRDMILLILIKNIMKQTMIPEISRSINDWTQNDQIRL